MAYYFFLRALTISQQFPPLAHHNQTSQYLWYWCIAETTLSACGCTSWENRSSSLSWAFSLSIFDSSAARAALVALIIKIINRSHLMSVQYMKWRSKAMSQGMHKSPFSVFFLVIRHRVFAKTQNIFSNSFFLQQALPPSLTLPSLCIWSAGFTVWTEWITNRPGFTSLIAVYSTRCIFGAVLTVCLPEQIFLRDSHIENVNSRVTQGNKNN